jgi:hypothetical protein
MRKSAPPGSANSGGSQGQNEASRSNSGFYDGYHRQFQLTGRTALFEEECTYNQDGSTSTCILCLEGKSPPVCFDSSVIERRMSDRREYLNAF